MMQNKASVTIRCATLRRSRLASAETALLSGCLRRRETLCSTHLVNLRTVLDSLCSASELQRSPRLLNVNLLEECKSNPFRLHLS